MLPFGSVFSGDGVSCGRVSVGNGSAGGGDSDDGGGGGNADEVDDGPTHFSFSFGWEQA